MPIPHRMLAVLALLSFTATAAAAQTRDVAGSRDYPGIGRFTGSLPMSPLPKSLSSPQIATRM